MLADPSEAFCHNSCKKIAQLIRVITAMADQLKDSKVHLNKISKNHENEIKEMHNDYIDQLNMLSDNMATARKTTIDKMCKHFGHKYKIKKGQYTSSIKEIASQFTDVANSFKKSRRECIQIETDITNNANEVARSADAFFSTAKKMNSKHDLNKYIKNNEDLQEIIKKISDLIDQNEKSTEQLKHDHKKKVQAIKTEIGKSLMQAMNERKPIFIKLQERNNDLKQYVDSNKKEYIKLQRDVDDFKEDMKQKLVYGILQTTVNEYNSIIREKKQIKRSLKEENHNQQNCMKEYHKKTALLKKSRKEELDSIQKQILNQNKQTKQLTDANQRQLNESKMTQDEYSRQLADKYASELITNKQEYNALAEQIKLVRDSFCNVKEKMSRNMSSCSSELDRCNQAFKDNLEKSENVLQSYFIGELRKFNSMIQGWESKYKMDYNEMFKHNFAYYTTVINANKKTKLMIEQMKEQMKNEERQKTNENNQKIIVFEQKFDQQLKEKKDRMNLREDQYANQSKTKRDNVYKTFEHDFNTKSNDIAKQNQELLDQEAEKEESKSVNDEIENIRNKKNKMNINHNNENDNSENEQKSYESLMRENIINEYERLLSNERNRLRNVEIDLNMVAKRAQETMEQLENTYKTTDKAIRAFQRSIKSETHNILSEFEIKINVEQVKLKEKIDNLSTLYTKEENQRGCEIIDHIRKVQQTKNRTRDLIIKQEREIEVLKQTYRNEEKKLRDEINTLKTGKAEENFLKDMARQQVERNNEIENREKSLDQKAEALKDLMKKEEENISSQKDRINKLWKEENELFEKSVKEIEESKSKIADEYKVKKEEISNEIEKKKEEMRKDYEIQVHKLKNRIECIKQQNEDAIKTIQNDCLQKKAELMKESDNKWKDIETNLNSYKQKLTSWDENTSLKQLDDRVMELDQRFISILLAAFAPTERRTVDSNKLYSAKLKSEDAKEQINSLINGMINFIKGERKQNEPIVQRVQSSRTQVKQEFPQQQTASTGRSTAHANTRAEKSKSIKQTTSQSYGIRSSSGRVYM